MQEITELFISVVDPNTGILYLDPDPEICPKFGSEDPCRFNRLMNKFRLNTIKSSSKKLFILETILEKYLFTGIKFIFRKF